MFFNIFYTFSTLVNHTKILLFIVVYIIYILKVKIQAEK